MNLQRVYWLALGWFGLVMTINGWLRYQDDGSLGAIIALIGLLIALVSARGVVDPDVPGSPDEPGIGVYILILAAALYTITTAVRFF